jgi:RNA polymerase sigma-70 factor (ECF subfamily)
MSDEFDPTLRIQQCLERFRAGDTLARDELLNCACEQLRRFTRRMLLGFPRVKRWEETDDVCQNAMLRLWRSLEEVTPASPGAFFSLAAQAIRRELIDLARHYCGPEGLGANHDSHPGWDGAPPTPSAPDKEDGTFDPGRLADWTEIHRMIAALPDEDREMFDLLWYHDLTQEAAAALLGVTDRTVRNRWQKARLRLCAALKHEPPEW